MCLHSYSQFFVLVLFGVIVGAIYYQVKRDDKGIQNRLVLSFLLIFSFGFFSSTTFQCIGCQLLPLQAQDPSGACFFDQSLQTLTEFNDVMGKESSHVRHQVQNCFVIIAVIAAIIAIILNPPLSVQWRPVMCLESKLTSDMTNWLALGKCLKIRHKSLWLFVVVLVLLKLLMSICVFFL